MTWPRFPSIRARMTAFFGLGAAALMVLSSLLLIWNSGREAENSARSSLATVSLSLRQPLRQNASLEEIKQVLVNHNVRSTRSGPWASEVEAWLISPQGVLKWKTGPFRPPRPMNRGRRGDGSPQGGRVDMPPDGRFDGGERGPDREGGAPPPRGAGEDGGEERRGGEPRGEDGRGEPPRRPLPAWMEYTVPPRSDGNSWRFLEVKRGTDTLILGVPWFRNARALRSQQLTLLSLALLVSAAAAVGAWFLVGKVLSPIEKLAGQASGLADQDSFEGRLTSTSSDAEMRNLTSTLNHMLASLGEAARSKERFHAAASHELRTPLQALSGHLQVALSRVRSADEYRLALEEAARQTERLSSLTRDLLMLNQLQMATTRPPHETVDVTEIVAQSIDRITMAGTKPVKIVENLEDFELEAAPSHLEMLTRNLIENAVKYVSEDGEIDIVLQNGALVIWNQTSALLKDGDLGRLFEPFFRPDVSRHSSTGGNGLGLSICRAICEANGWTISLLSEERESKTGVCAQVRFVSEVPESSIS